VSFYDEVLRELVLALGAALFVGNIFALVRRRNDARLASARTIARSRPGSPVKGNRRRESDRRADLPQAPVSRSVLYAAIGFVVMVWALASIVR
jgi:hypothetical protein